MARFKSKSKSSQEIPTSALPDIIFMLLFFFMVTTVMREQNILVEQELPKATQLQKLTKKSLVAHFYLGAPKDEVRYGSETRIQCNDVFIGVEDVSRLVEQQRSEVSEIEREQMTMDLKVDMEVKMGLINDVQEELKKVNARKVMYHSLERTKQ